MGYSESSLNKYLEQISRAQEILAPKIAIMAKAAQKIKPYYEYFDRVILPQLILTQERIILWQKQRKMDVRDMATLGWFPNWTTFYFTPENENIPFDEYMIQSIDYYFDEIKNLLEELCPNRKHIISTALSLHQEGNYIASIPLFISQSDGVCGENFGNFFNGETADKEILRQIDSGSLSINFLNEALLEPLTIELQIRRNSSKAAKKKFVHCGPNRHGIVHGSRKHLEYGTRINSYKSLSFLAYVVFLVKDELKKEVK